MNKEHIARELSKQIYKQEHKNEKPNVWVCGENPVSTSEKTKCGLGKVIYYDREIVSFFDKKVKKICVDCALKLKLTKFEREILG